MSPEERNLRISALAERSSYVENVLRHALIAGLSTAVWKRDPLVPLEVFNSEVDSAGFDVVLGLGSQVRSVQLKQAHAGRVPTHCSVRLSFSVMPGACVVLMSYALEDLRLSSFRFFGGPPSQPMADISALRSTKSSGRRNAAGQRQIRRNYRDVPVSQFEGPLTFNELLDSLFPLA
jgi:hypothetical protein